MNNRSFSYKNTSQNFFFDICQISMKLFLKITRISIKFQFSFKWFLIKTLNLQEGIPFSKKHSLSEIIKLNENFNLCGIWRVRNPHKKLLTFRQKHFTGIIQQRLDYIFLPNNLQESVKKTEILNALSFDHFPVFWSFVNNDAFARGQVFGNSIILYYSILSLLKN